MVTTPVPGLDRDEEILWRCLVELLVRLPHVLDEQFDREAKVSMAEYAVLVALSEAPDRELRMGELANVTALSRSRITRVVDDLARRSLVARRKCEQDARSALAALTPTGMSVLTSAYPGHLARVRALVLDHITRSEMRTMTQVLARVLEAVRERADD